jgi:hypothetical protein
MLITVNTADGMLTKATPKIVPGKRARKITVSSEQNGDIIVSVSPNIVITYRKDEINLEVITLNSKTGRRGWHGSAWDVLNTDDWKTIHFIINHKDALLASTQEEAIVESLRYILNKEYCIRPVVSEHVCQEVANLMSGKKSKSTFIGARKKMNA